MEILNQGGQESGPNAGSLTLSVRVRVRKRLLDFLQSANLKYVKLGYHYLISHAVYLFSVLVLPRAYSVLVLLRAYSAEIGRLSQRDLWRLWEQPHFDMTATLTFSGATVFTLCLYQYDHFSIKVKAYPRRESMKVHFLGILVLTAALLKTTDAVRNNGRVPLKPCRNLVFYYHEILYNGSNDHNATSAIVAAPKGDNLTALASNNNYRFGQMVVFDDPLTLDNNLHSPPVGRAQGFYFYDLKNTYGAWFSFTVVLNSTDHKGTITLAGADPMTVEYRDMSVVGGTGDFFMTRGIATLTTDTIQGEAYFRLRLNITLYECH